MPSITEIADEFFVACETGKGWEACKAYCTPGATFAAQAEPLADVKSLQQYCDWMKGMLGPIPDGRYELAPSPGEHALRRHRHRLNADAGTAFDSEESAGL